LTDHWEGIKYDASTCLVRGQTGPKFFFVQVVYSLFI
jgi:hypothetical protein